MKGVAVLVMMAIFACIVGMVWMILNGPVIAAVMFGALALCGFYVLSGVL